LKLGSNFIGPGDYMMTLALILPGAASVASPPLVVGGMLVGLLLLVSFAYMLSKTFQNMSDIQPEDRISAAKSTAESLCQRFASRPTLTTLTALVDGLRNAQTDDEAAYFTHALSNLTCRFFKADVVAWESWLRREGAEFVSNASADVNVTTAAVALPLSS